MSLQDDLNNRMKENYENRSKTYLTRRTPVAIRLDGVNFHTFTHGFNKPFDTLLMETMQETMRYLCEHIQGCVLGYTQSDEITLILQDYKTLTTDAWFNYSVQKICSIAASMATMKFNQYFNKEVEDLINDADPVFHSSFYTKDYMKLLKIYDEAIKKGVMFDARCFNIPKEEVTNLIYARQKDASRNSIQMVGQACFSHKELQNKSCSQIQDMLHEQKGINWNDFPTQCKRGSCCIKETYYCTKDGGSVIGEQDYENEDVVQRSKWVIDKEIPIFVNEGRDYIESRINFN